MQDFFHQQHGDYSVDILASTHPSKIFYTILLSSGLTLMLFICRYGIDTSGRKKNQMDVCSYTKWTSQILREILRNPRKPSFWARLQMSMKIRIIWASPLCLYFKWGFKMCFSIIITEHATVFWWKHMIFSQPEKPKENGDIYIPRLKKLYL